MIVICIGGLSPFKVDIHCGGEPRHGYGVGIEYLRIGEKGSEQKSFYCAGEGLFGGIDKLGGLIHKDIGDIKSDDVYSYGEEVRYIPCEGKLYFIEGKDNKIEHMVIWIDGEIVLVALGKSVIEVVCAVTQDVFCALTEIGKVILWGEICKDCDGGLDGDEKEGHYHKGGAVFLFIAAEFIGKIFFKLSCKQEESESGYGEQQDKAHGNEAVFAYMKACSAKRKYYYQTEKQRKAAVYQFSYGIHFLYLLFCSYLFILYF